VGPECGRFRGAAFHPIPPIAPPSGAAVPFREWRHISGTTGSCESCNQKELDKAADDSAAARAAKDASPGPKMDDEAVGKALKALTLKNSDEEEMTYTGHRPLEPERVRIMASAFPDIEAPGQKPYAVLAQRGGDTKEFIALVKSDPASEPPTVLMGSCSITYEDLSPADCIEYAFAEAPEEWRMSQLSREALETYRGMKFEAWKGMLVNPSCEAAFRRMLQIGMISQMYDPQVFPTPESQKAKYQVTDERTGKLIELPHPVKGLRVWDAGAQRYTDIEAQLTGAPSEADAAKWWEDFLGELSGKHGAEYIQDLIAGK